MRSRAYDRQCVGRVGWFYCRLYQYVYLDAGEWTCIESLTDNGGPAGVIYELLVACFYYSFIAASIAEVCTTSGFGYLTSALLISSSSHPAYQRQEVYITGLP